MRSAKHLIAAFGLIWLFTAGASAGENYGDWEPLETSVQQEPVKTILPTFRAFVNVRSDKFTFLIPDGFRLGGDPAHGRLQVENPPANTLITFTILGAVPADSTALAAGSFRQMLLKRYNGGKILAEFQGRAADGEAGPGFDISWSGAGGLAQRTRAVYLPTVAGVLELTVTSGAKNFPAAQSSLRDVMGSLRSSVNGKLVVHHLDNAS
jgi:hypothetical protein